MKTERLHYIDVAKGLLICFVVLSHIPQVIMKMYGYLTPPLRILENLDVFYVPYYMPAFFAITGFCCNFNEKFSFFFKKQFCTIMIPAFCLGCISTWINLIQDGIMDWRMYCKLGFRTFFLHGGIYWFLSALFLAKNIYYLFCYFFKYKYARLSLCILCLLFGILLQQIGLKEYWFITHAFMLITFLWIGTYIRDIKLTKPHYISASVLYVVLIIFELCLGFEIPYVTAAINVSYYRICEFLLFSILGIVGVLGLARCIGSNNVLEHLGKQSLVIYCLHISFEMLFAKYFYSLFSFDFWGYVFTFLLFIFTICSCSWISQLLSRPAFMFILGRI